MKKKLYRILKELIIILIISIIIVPNTIFAAEKEIRDYIKTLSIVTGQENVGNNYQIIQAAESLNDEEFDSWMDAMIGLINIALPKHNKIDDGARAYVIESNKNNTKSNIEEASEAMSILRLDIAEIADLENYMMTKFELQFLDKNFNEIPVVKYIFNGEFEINKKEQDRIMKFRKKLIDLFSVKMIGDTQKYIESSYLTYKAALAKRENNKDNLFNKSLDEKKKYSADEIKMYYKNYGYNYNFSSSSKFNEEKDELENAWRETLGLSTIPYLHIYAQDVIKGVGELHQGDTEEGLNEKDAKTQEIRNDPDKDTVFQMPKNITSVASKGPSDMVDDADAFLNDENSTNYLKTENLQSFSQSLYSILLGIGIVLSVIIGMILGIKLMLAPVGQKAEAKKLLIPYVVGCVLVFGAFGIWKLIITIMQGI